MGRDSFLSCDAQRGWSIRAMDDVEVGWIGQAIRPLEKADFLGRRASYLRQRVWAAAEGERITGLVSAEPWAFIVFRDARTFKERLEVDAEVHYPVLPTHLPEQAAELLEVALRWLEDLGCEHAYLVLPADSHGP